MARSHYIKPTVPNQASLTARLGSSGSSNNYSYADEGKFVKFSAESGYALCAAGDPIEGVITSVENATQNQFSIGGVAHKPPLLEVVADGLQATPGTGTIALGDYVVCGTVVARGTALTDFPKVCKATQQPNATYADLAAALAAVKNQMFGYRVVSLGSGGVGTVGAKIVIQAV